MMNMKKLIVPIFYLLITLSVSAQTDRLSINVLVPDNALPAEAQAMLSSKLSQIVTNYGLADNGLTDRFFITPEVIVSVKDIVPSNPPRVSQKLDVVLMIGDVIDNKLYGSYTIPLVGVGQNETKAYLNAFNRMPVRSKPLESFMQETKEKIVTYYLQNGNDIIDKAEYLAKSGQYDVALESLLSIPDFCGSISSDARDAALVVYQMKIDGEGESALKKAKMLWEGQKDEKAFIEALEIIQNVPQGSKAEPRCEVLVLQMSKYLDSERAKEEQIAKENRARADERENREWEFKMKQYEDRLELERQQLKDQTALEKARIETEKVAANRQGRIDINKVTRIVKSWAGSRN